MKPRLMPVSLTNEDLLIFLNHRGDAYRAYRMGWSYGLSRAQDRRDADLMLQLTDLGAIGAYANVRIMQAWWGQDGFGFTGGLIEWRGKPVQV